MRIANRVERNKLVAGIVCIVAAGMLAVTPSFAQNDRSGVAHPDASVVTISPDPVDTPAVLATTPKAKPSAAIPAGTSETVYGSYVPYRAPGSPAASQAAAAFDPDANIVTEATAGGAQRRLL